MAITELAAVTKITADPITGLAGFSAVAKSAEGVAQVTGKVDWLKAYKSGKLGYAILKEDAESLALTAVLTVAQDLNPAIRAINVTRTFVKNVEAAASIGEGSQMARKEVAMQLASLETKIAAIEAKINGARHNDATRRPLVMEIDSLDRFCERY